MARFALREVPVGIKLTGTRRERDPIGPVDVPADKYWGASTQRALKSSPVADAAMPERFFRSYGYVKKAAAAMNTQAGRMPSWKSTAIARAADDLIGGLLADHFPLPVWQSGSGRDADSNVNEVLANRAAQLLGAAAGCQEPVDPARDVNMGLSLASSFTTSLYIATIFEIEQGLVPRCSALARAVEQKAGGSFGNGRRLRAALLRLDEAEGSLHEIGADISDEDTVSPITPGEWQLVVDAIAADTAKPFIRGPDGFSNRGSLDALVAAMTAIRGVATVLLDIVDAIHAACSADSRTGILAQAEAIAMVCTYAIGQDQVVAAAASRGNAAACTARPLVVVSILNSLRRLGEGCEAMRRILMRAH